MIDTCKRLHKTFFTLPWQRKWLLLGKEPPNLDDGVLHPQFAKCEKCGARMFKSSLKNHKCFMEKIDYTYCNWCMSKILPNVPHDLNKCLKSGNARCNECATWHDKEGLNCPFRLVACRNKIHEKTVSHRKCEFQKCEVCGLFLYCGDRICPCVVPRCWQHRIHECNRCSLLIDNALQETHKCALLIDRLSVSFNCDIKLTSNQVYFGIRYNKTVLFVADVYKIPPLLEYAKADVVLFSEEEVGQFDFTTLVRFERHDPYVQTHDLFPKAFCCKCLTTVPHKLTWCRCRKVLFCSHECVALAWPEHSKWCNRK